jgi:Druantia protein DruA
MMKPIGPTPATISFCGRTFSADEIDLMRQIAADCSALGTTEIARTVCELLDWKRPTGRLKNHECRQLLERLAAEGCLRLPALRKVGPQGPRRIARTPASDPQPEITGSPRDFEPLTLTLVKAGSRDSMLWNELVDRHHYLRYRVPVGAHLRYFVRSKRLGETILACLQWSSPAWRMAARDRWIGWNDQQRRRNLQRIVNQSRFLILPWVHVPGLASKILAHSIHQLPSDFERHYDRTPLLVETLVEAYRFSGTCYRAANWIFVGETRGRGRMDRYGKSQLPKKLVFVYPLCESVQQRLRGVTR